MKKGTIIPLVLGLGLGVVAIKFFLSNIQKARADARNEVVPAVVTVDDIPATAEITPAMLKVLETPMTPLLGRDSFQQVKDVVGRVAQTTIPRGSIVREELLAPEGTPAGLMVRIPKGYRAVSVKINEVSAVGYQLRPGTFVDVIAVMRVGRANELVSRIILQQIKVVAVGRMLSSQSDDGGKSKAAQSVTLLVKDSDVPKLHLAQTEGKITLAMRSPDDNIESEPGHASRSEILGLTPPPLAKPVVSQSLANFPVEPEDNYDLTVVDGKGRVATHSFSGRNSTRRASSDDPASRRTSRRPPPVPPSPTANQTDDDAPEPGSPK
jgi:pilus assembly protein CpaB